MERSKIIYNRQTFTADTPFINLESNNVQNVNIGFDFLQNGSTAPTLANILSAIGNVRVYEGGELLSEILFQDLWALNKMVMQHRPVYLLPAGDGQVGFIGSVMLPIRKSTAKELKAWLNFVGHSTIKSPTLTLGVHFIEGNAGKGVSIGYITDTAAVDFKEYDMSKIGKALTALLIYNTTVPTASANSCTVGELKLTVKRVPISHYQHEEMDESLYEGVGLDAERTILEKYRYIQFDEPIPADSLKIALKGIGATDTFRLIGLYA
jgi:hypothetical protein